MNSLASSLSSEENNELQQSAIEERLKLTPEQRIEAHENARQLLNDLKNAGDTHRAKPESAS